MRRILRKSRQEVAAIGQAAAARHDAFLLPGGPASAEFLKEIETGAEALAGAIARRNPAITARDVNAAVQQTVLRLLFLRLAEDRGLEPPGQLMALSAQPDSYARFICRICRAAHDKYRSALFCVDREAGLSSAPAGSSPNLSLDDGVFRPILQHLYRTHDPPRDLRALPVEVLGAVYERLQARGIRQPPGHPVRIERKPAGRKAGGVYYTPVGIVDYVVQQTVGRHLAGNSPAVLSGERHQPPWRVVDIACGSGSFLLGAYQCLLDHYLQWYIGHRPQNHPRAVYREAHRSAWRLTRAERIRILTTHVCGVDIDPQAVEVAKLSLVLKAFAEPPDTMRPRQETLFGDEALPTLADNLKCGDALIGPEFYEQRSEQPFDRQPGPRLNLFDWQTEFRQVMDAGGFDAVIGNPPYVNTRTLFQEQGEAVKQFFAQRYQTARRGYDLYVLFIERAWELLRDGGRCGMIVPNKIAALDYAEACRAMLLKHTTIENITDVSELRLFPAAGVYPYIMTWRKTPPRGNASVRVVHAAKVQDLVSAEHCRTIPQRAFTAAGGFTIHGTLAVESRVATECLGKRAQLHSGTTGFAAGQMADALCEQAQTPRGEHFAFVVSGNIDRYAIQPGDVRFMKRRFARPVLAADCEHLSDAKRRLFREPKLIIAGMTKRLEVALDQRGGLALGVAVYAAAAMTDDPLYLLGLLNSRLLSYLFRIRFQAKHLAGGFLAVNKGQLAKLPIRVVDFAVAAEKRKHDRIVALAEQMTKLLEPCGATGSDGAAANLRRRIAATDAAIDRLVYELYGLTDAEVRMVEDATGDFPGSGEV